MPPGDGHRDDPLDDRPDLRIDLRGEILAEEERRNPAIDQDLFQGDHLAAVAERVAAEEADLRQAVEDDPRWAVAVQRLANLAGHRDQLDVGRVEDRVLPLPLDPLGFRVEVEDLDPVQVPPVHPRIVAEFLLRLRERHIQHRLSPPRPLDQELHPQGRLARAREPANEIHSPGQQTALEDFVQPFNPGRQAHHHSDPSFPPVEITTGSFAKGIPEAMLPTVRPGKSSGPVRLPGGIRHSGSGEADHATSQ